MNNPTIKQQQHAAIFRLKKSDFPGYGQDAAAWIRTNNKGMPFIEILPKGTGGLDDSALLCEFRNLWDDKETLTSYKEKMIEALNFIRQ